MALDPFPSGEGLDATKPVAGLDPFPEETARRNSPLKTGFGAGVSAVKSNLLGAGALVAHGIGATGAEDKLLAASGAASDEAAKSSRSLEDVDWTSPKSVTDHLKYVFGNALPSLALMAAGGVAGRGLGAMAGASGRALNAASLAGAVAPDVALEAGGIYPEAIKTGESNPALKSAVGGAAAASLDFLSVPAAVRRLMPEVKALSKGGFGAAIKGALTEAPKVGAIEAGQEFGQSVIERYSAGQSLTDKDAISDYANSAFGGFVPGVAIGVPPAASMPRPAPRRRSIRSRLRCPLPIHPSALLDKCLQIQPKRLSLRPIPVKYRPRRYNPRSPLSPTNGT